MSKIQNPVKAIRAFCMDCMGGSRTAVSDCTSAGCALYPFRYGKNPYRTARKLTDEQKERLSEQLSRARIKNAQQE